MTTTIAGCPRCGGTHEMITLVPFARPPATFSHFAMCPATNEPILVETVQSPTPDREPEP